MSPDQIEELAHELLRACEAGAPVNVLPSARSGFDLDAAYQVETALKRCREAAGVAAVGRKVGYANRAVWRVLKLETLVWAHMYESTIHYTHDNFAALSVAHPRSLKIEPEIVFGLQEAVSGKDLDAAAVLAATEWIALGFEIIDCPYPAWKFEPSDFVASFGLHTALVVGDKVAVQPDRISALIEELALFKLRMKKNGEVVEEGSGKNSLKSPPLCVAELGAAIGRRFPFQPLGAGEIVSSGTLTSGHPIVRGDVWKAEVEGILLPPLTLRLA